MRLKESCKNQKSVCSDQFIRQQAAGSRQQTDRRQSPTISEGYGAELLTSLIANNSTDYSLFFSKVGGGYFTPISYHKWCSGAGGFRQR